MLQNRRLILCFVLLGVTNNHLASCLHVRCLCAYWKSFGSGKEPLEGGTTQEAALERLQLRFMLRMLRE